MSLSPEPAQCFSRDPEVGGQDVFRNPLIERRVLLNQLVEALLRIRRHVGEQAPLLFYKTVVALLSEKPGHCWRYLAHLLPIGKG